MVIQANGVSGVKLGHARPNVGHVEWYNEPGNANHSNMAKDVLVCEFILHCLWR
jgi:hypothetical protein